MFKIKPKEIIYVDNLPLILPVANKLGMILVGFKSALKQDGLEQARFQCKTFKEIQKIIEKLKNE